MKKLFAGLVLASLFTAPLMASEKSEKSEYTVTITNITSGTVFTPIYVISHERGLKLFELGQPASDELAAVAEGGDFSSLDAALAKDDRVVDTADSGGLLLPGESVSVTVKAPRRHGRISLVSMMLPTNDGFIALSNVRAPRRSHNVTYTSPGYDAGSEPNDELCISIPGGGPCGGGEGGSPGASGEGYVHIHSGIHGIGDLTPAGSDWNNPAATISITQARK